jgi:glycosyltransferase involved in cell wall biosynthesis
MDKRISPAMVALFTGGIDRHYACAIGKALVASGVALDVIGNAEMDSCGMLSLGNARLFELYAMPRSGRNPFIKLLSFLAVYLRIISYAANSSPCIFHILWHYKFPYFDRTFLLLYYKLLGKKLVFTAHNVNAAERDGVDSFLNRFTLRFQYHLIDHLFVHTASMKEQLIRDFAIASEKVTVIPFGVGDMVPDTSVTPTEAKLRLGLRDSDRSILFFGRIVEYIAGEPIKESAQHWEEVYKTIQSSPMREQVIQDIRYIADEEMETYLKAADVLVLPYKQIFQSGVLFMSHNFGLPVIATDVGTFRDDIIEGTNGFVCRPNDTEDLARRIEDYFSSDLYRNLDERRAAIQKSVRLSHSWSSVARTTRDVYARFSPHPALEHSASSGHFTRVPLNDQSDAAKPHDL